MPHELKRPERTFTIRQLCVEFKVTPRALRFYEDKGLLAPARDGMNRVYSHRDRGRLQLILRGKRVGFSLSDIRDILDMYDEKDGGAAQTADSIKRFKAQIAVLQAQREDIDGAIVSLEEGIERLQAQLDQLRAQGGEAAARLPEAAERGSGARARPGGGHPAAAAAK